MIIITVDKSTMMLYCSYKDERATNYGAYFTLESTSPVALTDPADANVASSAKMYFNYVSHADNGRGTGGNTFILEVVSFEIAS